MPKLTDTQLIILSTASQRDDGTALPLPKSIKADGKARTAALKGLLKRRLLAEQPATRNGAVWREAKDGQRLTLTITDAGRAAIGDAPEPDGQSAASAADTRGRKTRTGRSAPAAKPEKAPANSGKGKAASPATGRAGTKQEMLIGLLRRPDGATIEEAMKTTGWQAHSVRGAISGALRKKRGLEVASEKVEGRGRIYRIVAGS